MEDFVTRCDKKMGRHSKCAQIAAVRVIRTDDKGQKHVRCCCARHSSGIKHNNDQGITLEIIHHDWAKIHAVLQPLVGKTIYSKWHRRELIVKYVKNESMILMCQDSRYGKAIEEKAQWCAVYAKEITEVK